MNDRFFLKEAIVAAAGVSVACAAIWLSHSGYWVPTASLPGEQESRYPVVVDKSPLLSFSEDVDRGLLLPVQQYLHPSNSTFGVNVLLHALLIWGPEATFEHADPQKRVRVLDVLLGLSQHPYLPQQALLFYLDADGLVHSRTVQGTSFRNRASKQGHYDQIVAILGELGIPTSQPLRVQGLNSPTTLGKAFDSILQLYEPGLEEPEWTALAIAYYLPPQRQWTNRWGETYSFDDLARELLDRPYEVGACGGTHILYVLAVLLRVDDTHSVLSPACRQSIVERLQDVKRSLTSYQRPDGAWSRTWATRVGTSLPLQLSSVSEELRTITGHHLEWLSIAPPELRPDEVTLARALRWCIVDLQSLPVDELPDRCPPTHTLMTIYRNCFAEQMLDRRWLRQ